MARTTAAPLILTALLALGAAPALLGCEAHAQLGGNANSPPPPPPAPAPAPPAPAPPKSTVVVKDGRLGVPGNIVYETGKAVIKPESEPTLNALKDFMTQNKNFTRIRIEGHTDNVGKSPDNLKLSQDRAAAVIKWLSDHGGPNERCLAVGFGDGKPIADNKTEDAKAQNRPTAFT